MEFSGIDTGLRKDHMKADPSALVALLQLQQIDIDTLRAQKKLDELPQRDVILGLRKKRAEIESKMAQVEKMRETSDKNFSKINDEDARLIEKQKSVQEKIDHVQGDYRAVDSLTKELGGIAKRRNTLETELASISERVSQIAAVQEQIMNALALVNTQESEKIASFQKEGGALTNEIARLQNTRKNCIAEIGEDLFSLYEKKSSKGGGIGVARLNAGSCGVCRNKIDDGKLLQIRAEAPLSECPACKRLLVVVND